MIHWVSESSAYRSGYGLNAWQGLLLIYWKKPVGEPTHPSMVDVEFLLPLCRNDSPRRLDVAAALFRGEGFGGRWVVMFQCVACCTCDDNVLNCMRAVGCSRNQMVFLGL